MRLYLWGIIHPLTNYRMSVKGVIFGLVICILLAHLLARQLAALPPLKLFGVTAFGGLTIFGLIIFFGQYGKAKD